MAAPPPVQTEAATSSFPFSAALAMPHPDESIQKKHEEKLKAAEEKLISLKGILFFVLRDNNFGYRWSCTSKNRKGRNQREDKASEGQGKELEKSISDRKVIEYSCIIFIFDSYAYARKKLLQHKNGNKI